MKLPQADPRGRRAALHGFRIMRFTLLALVGLFMAIAGILTWNTGSLGNAGGWFSQHWGPHGNSLGGILFGSLFALLGIFLLVRTIRRVREERAAGLLPPR